MGKRERERESVLLSEGEPAVCSQPPSLPRSVGRSLALTAFDPPRLVAGTVGVGARKEGRSITAIVNKVLVNDREAQVKKTKVQQLLL